MRNFREMIYEINNKVIGELMGPHKVILQKKNKYDLQPIFITDVDIFITILKTVAFV